MKQLLCTSLLLSYLLSLQSQIVTYDFAGTSNPTPSSIHALASATDMTRGSGLNQAGSNIDLFSSNGYTINAGAIQPNDFVEFTVEPDANYELDLSEFHFQMGRSSTGPENWELRTSLDSYASAIASGTTDIVASSPGVSSSAIVVDLSATTYNAITAPFTVRLFAYGATGSTGAWRLDHVQLIGEVYPENSCRINQVTISSLIADDNGTSMDPSDDTYSFSLQPVGLNLGANYHISGDFSFTNVSYGAPASYGPFDIMNGSKVITIADAIDANCEIDVHIPAPSTVSEDHYSVGGGYLEVITDPGAAGESAAAQAAAATLNNQWIHNEEALQNANYFPVYGTFNDDCGGNNVNGSASSLVLSDENSSGTNYGATGPGSGTGSGTVAITFRTTPINLGNLSTINSTDIGNATTSCGSNGGVREDANNTLQGNAPQPSGEMEFPDEDNDGNYDYYNYDIISNSDRTALRIDFSEPVEKFGFYLGDTESRSDLVDGYPAAIFLYDSSGDLIAKQNIPTGTVDQSNCDGDSNDDFDGCGNDETVWVQYHRGSNGPRVEDVLVVVGEVTSEYTTQNPNSLSISGLTLGGITTGVFPIELLSFKGEARQGQVELLWRTGNNPQDTHFELDHSFDGERYRSLGMIVAPEMGNDPNTFRFTDYSPVLGRNYYRLRQVDLNGQSKEAGTLVIQVKEVAKLTFRNLFPQPVKENFTLSVDLPAHGQASLDIMDLQGQIIQTHMLRGNLGSNSWVVSLAGISRGLYIYRLKTNSESHVGQLVKH